MVQVAAIAKKLIVLSLLIPLIIGIQKTSGMDPRGNEASSPEIEWSFSERKNLECIDFTDIFVVYDNNTYDKRLKTAWGF